MYGVGLIYEDYMKDKKLDLGYGNPGFIQELWPKHSLLSYLDSKNLMPYSYAKKINSSLEEKIKEIHIKYKNALITDSTKIVVTIGAVQALQAAMSYYKNKGFNKVYIPHPFWGRFKDFTNLNQLQIVSNLTDDSFSLITSPNNPDGEDFSLQKASIRDACYNWPHYNKTVSLYSDPVSVFSLSKLSGHSSTRIGWAVVQDEEIAKYLTNYVNIYSSGISIESQLQAKEVVNYLINHAEILEQSLLILNDRLNLLKEIIKNKNLPIKELSYQGMFWYIQASEKLIQKLNIECPRGEDFNDPRPNCFRLNLGVDSLVFEEFIKRVNDLN